MQSHSLGAHEMIQQVRMCAAHAWRPEFDLWDPHEGGRRDKTVQNCPLTSMWTIAHAPHIICMHKITIIHRFAFSFIFMWSFSFSAMGQSMCTVREEGAQTSQTTFRTSGPRENTGLQISFSGPISELVKQIQRKIYPTNFCYHPRLP